MIEATPRLHPLAVALPPLAAIVWLLAIGAGYGAAVYLLPLALATCCVAGIVLLAAAAGRAWAFGALLVLVTFGLAINFRERDPGEVGLDLQNGVKLLTWTSIVALAAFNLRRLAPMLREPVVALACIYAGFALASTFWSLAPAYTAGNAIGWFAYLALACLAVRGLGERTALLIMVASLSALVALNLSSIVFAPAQAWMPATVEEPGERLRGFSGHPNVLGQQAGILVTLAVVTRRVRHLPRRWFLAALCLGVAAIALTGSRTTIIAVATAWGFIALRERGLLTPVLGFGIALAAISSGLLAIGVFPDLEAGLAFLSRSGSGDEVLTLTGRTELWEVSWERIQERPVFGWGYNATEALLLNSMGRTFYGDAVNAHNMFIQSLLSLGAVGSLAGFAMVLILIGRIFARPDAMRDHVVVFMLVSGMGEVEIFATPMLLTLTVFMILAREAEQCLRFERVRDATERTADLRGGAVR